MGAGADAQMGVSLEGDVCNLLDRQRLTSLGQVARGADGGDGLLQIRMHRG